MSKTLISWTDETANPLTGCNEEGPECLNCYARIASASPRLQQFEKYHGVVNEKGRWTGQINFAPDVLEKLLHKRKPCKIFMPSMSDMFHPGVKDDWIMQMLGTMALTPHITYQVLTKRPERMLEVMGRRELINELFLFVENVNFCGMKNYPALDRSEGFLKNLWLGVTAGTQKSANDRIPYLEKLAIIGYTTFVSVEPMLEDINLMPAFVNVLEQHNRETEEKRLVAIYENNKVINSEETLANHGCTAPNRRKGISQIIIGGESGPNSRPFHLEWAQSLMEQCRDTNTRVFMKQVGSNAFYQGKPFKTKSRSGSDISEWPEWAQIQEFPTT